MTLCPALPSSMPNVQLIWSFITMEEGGSIDTLRSRYIWKEKCFLLVLWPTFFYKSYSSRGSKTLNTRNVSRYPNKTGKHLSETVRILLSNKWLWWGCQSRKCWYGGIGRRVGFLLPSHPLQQGQVISHFNNCLYATLFPLFEPGCKWRRSIQQDSKMELSHIALCASRIIARINVRMPNNHSK